jgi:hypothetical protein
MSLLDMTASAWGMMVSGEAFGAVILAFEDGKQCDRKQLLADLFSTVFHQLRTISGKIYQNAHITSIDAVSVTISHRDGSSRVVLSDLPSEIRKRFP